MSKIWHSMVRGSKALGRTLGFDSVAPGLRKKTPAPTPLPDEEELKRIQRRMLASRVGQTGRASTILSGDDESLG